ncbi:M domain protein [Clostridium tyrobutyricum]|nr:M domain protein [Clostridium tyrobutyricum]
MKGYDLMNNEEKILNLLGNLTGKVDSMDNRFDLIQSRLDELKSQTTENTQILKALEHNSQIHKAEIDNLTHVAAKISGDVKSIKSAVIKGQKAYDFLENFNNFSSSEN